MNTNKFVGGVALIVLVFFTERFSAYRISRYCRTNRHTNGCSIPGDLDYFYKGVFKPGCDRHDICYGCGRKYRISRDECDRVFEGDLKDICSSDRSVKFDEFCRAIAATYAVGVRVGGAPHYSRSSPRWCSQRWVRYCLRV